MQLDKSYWEDRYKANNVGWNIGHPSTPIKAYIDQLKDKSISILIPGAGNAYEAEYLHKVGFTDVSVIDLAPSPLNNLLTRVPQFPKDKAILGDFFEHQGNYDLIIEQTFFCALDPNLRNSYIEKVHDLLNPNGTLAGLLFNKVFDKAGPPFGGTIEDYKLHFENLFHIKTMEPSYNSIEPRADAELFFILKKIRS
ncbi:TPMT family class I SAM-dependent methyltransferase [Saprospiraceae bacterium]|nr:TPMT family class I SAM-dependent methyltransferase [Saprospiraceae bacterium]